MGVSSTYTVTTTVTDADTPLGMLIYSGSISSCGIINSMVDTVSCPNLATYSGSVTVTDPSGLSDTQTFLVPPCSTGSAP
jgi:hypothetical protein